MVGPSRRLVRAGARLYGSGEAGPPVSYGAGHWALAWPRPHCSGEGGAPYVREPPMERVVLLDYAPAPVMTPGGAYLRVHCPAPEGCGWMYEEPIDPGPVEQLDVGDGSGEAMSTALSAHAQERERQIRKRVTKAVAAHVTEAHHAVAWSVGEPEPRTPRPTPRYPYPAGHAFAKVARFDCPAGCAWTVDVSTDLGVPTMESAPPELIAVVQARMQARTTMLVEAFWRCVTDAIRKHVDDAHAEVRVEAETQV
ncbi:hypothetical protein OV450_1337 [Actinobacteria bacterium OV450]|nr:hypothetical protein OV450_1337 [Actinobacteria bacterium OV450]